jgi:uncharacterized protein (DUF1330 family)
MKQTAMLVLSLLTGFVLGAGAIPGLHAQGQKRLAYLVAEPVVTDPAAFQAYAAKVAETLKGANARVLANGKPDVKEGASAQGNIVIIAFDSLADAEKWYNEPPYHPLIAERQKAAQTRLYIVEGLPQ